MNIQSLTSALSQNHNSFIGYINDLSNDEYSFRYGEKWTARQQLEHIVLCVKPLVRALSTDKTVLEQNFGVATNPGRTYEELLNIYVSKLSEGGKAPEKFVPQSTLSNEREILSETLAKLIADLNNNIENFSEQELNRLCLPHPLLGNISIREMLYNAIYHVEHHHILTKQNLTHK
jgi:hypothetical protein